MSLAACADAPQPGKSAPAPAYPQPVADPAGSVAPADHPTPPSTSDSTDEQTSPQPSDAGRPAPSPPGQAPNPPPMEMPPPDAPLPIECTEGPNKSQLWTPKVYYGTERPTHVHLSPGQIKAIGNFSGCSGTVIAQRWIATASHCGLSDRAEICFGAQPAAADTCISGVQAIDHPRGDLTLLELARDIRTVAPDIEPIPLFTGTLDDAWLGRTAEASGYGRNERGSSGVRAFTAEPIVSIWQDNVTIDGEGERGVCFGDSGGPLMVRAGDGSTRVAGVLSNGDGSCVGRDNYTRIDTYLDWIEEHTGPALPPGPQPCGDVDVIGRCDAGATVATYCEGEVLSIDRCQAGRQCGWSAQESGWRCLPSDQDPCQGVTYRGACEGGVLTWCEAGVVVSRDCGACGETCTEGAVDVGFICQPSDCGDLDYQGRCEGNVAHWCRAGGQRDTRDCAAQNQVCGYVGRETGYFCMDAGACGEVGYMGVCEGGTSIWCDEGRRRSLACTDDGRVCRYVNDNVGNYCTDCGDVDYRGQCEGATARWCNDRGQLETRDCAAQGEVCRYVDDDTGFFCADP